MCHSDDSRPPGPPRRGEVSEHGLRTLISIDGNEFAAYRARPAAPSRVGIVVLPDVRGLHPFYMDLAQRFAEGSFEAIAIDYFGRTAGAAQRDSGFDWQQHVPKVTPEHVRADAEAAADELRAGGAESIFTVGFCFGGGHSWRLAASDAGLAGTIGFYGRPALVQDVIEDIHVPILMLIAGNDAATPRGAFHDLEQRLARAGKEHEMHVYEGAPHSFFDRTFDDWQGACIDAWERIINFTDNLTSQKRGSRA